MPVTVCTAGCTGNASATVTVALTPPADLKVGGALYPAQYKAHYVGFNDSCSDPTCSVSLTSPGFTITVQGTNGYSQCTAKTQTNCEYALGTRRSTGSPIQQSQTLTVGFYFATQPNQAVHGSVSGHAQLTEHWMETITTVTAIHGTTTRQVPKTQVIYASGIHVIVNGPNTLPVESGNQVP